MKKQKLFSICITLFATIVFTILVTPICTPSSGEEQIAREYFSQKSGIPIEEVYVGVPAIIIYTTTMKTIWQASVGDRAGNRMEIVTIDRATHEVINGQVAYEAEQKARLEKYGKLDPVLYERLQLLKVR